MEITGEKKAGNGEAVLGRERRPAESVVGLWVPRAEDTTQARHENEPDEHRDPENTKGDPQQPVDCFRREDSCHCIMRE